MSDLVIDIVCRHFNITRVQLMKENRKREMVYARRICFAILYDRVYTNKQKIGNIFGQDHSTVIYHLEQHETSLKMYSDDQYSKDFKACDNEAKKLLRPLGEQIENVNHNPKFFSWLCAGTNQNFVP